MNTDKQKEQDRSIIFVNEVNRIIDKLWRHHSKLCEKYSNDSDVATIGAVTLVDLRTLRDNLSQPQELPKQGEEVNEDAIGWIWTDELVLEYAVRSHLPNRELTIEEFKKLKQ